jgi:hypothetical protein
MRRVHDSYVELLADRLGDTLAKITAGDALASRQLLAQLRELPDDSFSRFLTAPETSFRLLWNRHSAADALTFLQASLAAEAHRAGRGQDFCAEDRWTALGDYCVRADGSVFRAPVLPGPLLLDLDSPHALRLDFNGRADTTLVPREALTSVDRERALGGVARAWAAVGQVSEGLQEFVRVFTKVLILQSDPEAPTMFASGSSGQYVGRSVLSNPHLLKVDEVELAEGMVHEAIHSLLYMQEQRRRWVAPELYGSEIRTESPWTGNPLPLRPYLQACFVWYGLLHFWAAAVQSGSFPTRRVNERLAQCAKGFLEDEFESPLNQYRSQISEDILSAIGEIRREVAECAQVFS